MELVPSTLAVHALNPEVHVLNCVVGVLNSSYSRVAQWLTGRENHRLASEHRDALVLKRVLFEMFDAYAVRLDASLPACLYFWHAPCVLDARCPQLQPLNAKQQNTYADVAVCDALQAGCCRWS